MRERAGVIEAFKGFVPTEIIEVMQSDANAGRMVEDLVCSGWSVLQVANAIHAFVRSWRGDSVATLAKRHGIDLSKVEDQQEAIDLETGKRFSDS